MDEGITKPGMLARILKTFRKNSLSPTEFEEEINDLLDHGAESGAITKSSGDMIQSIVEFSDTIARKIMTPRIAVVGVEINATINDVIETMKQEGYSRLPVYEGDLDHIIGFLMAKDLLRFWGTDPSTPLPRELIRTITLVHSNKKIGDILSELRHKKNHLAVVLDEYGGTAGLITMEDIIEEIIGDIHDEYDEEEDDNIRELSPGLILATGQSSISDLNQTLEPQLPEGDYETLGGFLTDLVSRVPLENEIIEFEDYVFLIKAADNRKVDQVEIRLKEPKTAEQDSN